MTESARSRYAGEDGERGVGSFTPDQLRSRVDALQGRVAELMGSVQESSEQLAEQLRTAAETVGEAAAYDGGVAAKVSPYGEVVDLVLDSRTVAALGASRLRETLLSVIANARADALAKAARLSGEEAIRRAKDPVGSMLDAIPEVTEALPDDLVVALREHSRHALRDLPVPPADDPRGPQ